MKNKPTPTSRQLLIRKIFPWALVAFLFLFGLGVAFLSSFSVIAAVVAWIVLFSWAVYSVSRRAMHKQRSFFEVSRPLFSYVICGVLIATGSYLLFDSIHAITRGSIHIAIHPKYSSMRGSGGMTFYRADNPGGFWGWVCGDCYFALVFFYIAIIEVIITLKQRNHVKHKPVA
ncbi:hypothetical protein [Pedosphaera parvula]|uniref:Uncharacterized protein n=1 Tax=Pedosphaera parvula (strain Ellin514) TaxID=320771 RepID=B9XF18_PEDPL|nr:hypothetical protein [Pedosphaera parvula]EEF61516.1 hypothetical protein Cflav_PD4194 [Pedosphaera parvula Ellin514]